MFFRLRLLNSLASLSFTAIVFLIASFMSGCASTKKLPDLAQVTAQTEPSVKNQQKTRDISAIEEVSPSSIAPEPIQILGGVKKPGNIPYRKGADLTFYLSEAGAPQKDSDIEKIQIIRGEPGKKIAQEFSIGNGSVPAVQSGDIVIVHLPKKTFIEKSFAVAASAAAILGTAALLILVV